MPNTTITPDYTDDERIAKVDVQREAAIRDSNKAYDKMIGESDSYFESMIDSAKQYAAQQSKAQQALTDFTIQKIEQQKDWTEQDYKKEQSASYVDWQKESNAYSTNAEQMAAAGLKNSGYSETSQVKMYTAYQNRVAVAREAFIRAIQNYDNMIKEAQLQGNAALAEIALNALKTELELSLQGFQYKNQLILDKANKELEIKSVYHDQYMDVLNQINTENAMAADAERWQKEFDEGVRRSNEEAERWQIEFDESVRQFNKEYNQSLAASKSKSGGGSGGGAYTLDKSGGNPTDDDKPAAYEVDTDYYKGDLNPDAKKYGVFANGYQPKGISGHGAVTKTGDKVKFTTQTLSGASRESEQNIWKTPDGKLWYWEGRENKYKPFSKHGGGGGKF